jgi:hypothetical protein
MRIAYLCYWDLEAGDGVAQKVHTQVDAWRAAGHDVLLESVVPAAARERLRQTRAAAASIERFAPDVLYVRYDVFLPPAWLLVRRQRTIVEVNSNDRSEWRLRSRGVAAYNELNRRALLSAAAGTVAVAHELAPTRVRTLVLGNGVDPAACRALPAPANERPRLVFIGSPHQPWQGFDKVAQLARALPGVDVDVIGPTAAQLADAPANMTVHGHLAPDEYRPVLARADVALGTLALHRKSMDEASPLKVREYLLSGIPTVVAYDDTDLRGLNESWLLRLPNTESNVEQHAADIEAFAERIRGARVPRGLAEDRLGSPAKERRRLEFFARVAQRA